MPHIYVVLCHDESAKRPVCGKSESGRRSLGVRSRRARGDAQARRSTRNLGTPGSPVRRASSRLRQSRGPFAIHSYHHMPSRGPHRALEISRETQQAYAQLDHYPGSRGVSEPHTRRPTTWQRKVDKSISNLRLTVSLMHCSVRPMGSSPPSGAA